MWASKIDGQLVRTLQDILRSAIEVSDADFGNIQLLDPQTSDLKIVVHHGFSEEWLGYWNSRSRGKGVCGTALERGERVIVEDVEQSPIFQGTDALEVQRRAGVRAVQSTPVKSRAGKWLGMFSTHYRKPGRPDPKALRVFDLLATQTGDILELKQIEGDLKKGARLLEEAQEMGQLGCWEWDIRTGKLTWSKQQYAIFGVDPDHFEPTISTFLPLIHPEDLPMIQTRMGEVIAHGGSVDLDHRIIRPDGSCRTLWTRGEPTGFDEHGSPSGFAGINQDITERKRLENELRSAVSVRDEFISIASHELKTPLTALRVQLELLGRALTPELIAREGKLPTLVNSAFRSAKDLSALLDDLLDVTRIRVGTLSLEPQPMDLRVVLLEQVEWMMEPARQRGCVLTTDAVDPIRGVWDPRRVKQILANLLSNAMKFGEGRPVEVRLSVESGMARIDVRDRGIGIAKDMQPKIFDRFQRANDGKDLSGLGLGLYIVREIAIAHSGSVTVESELGQGATFTVRLPLERKN